MPKAACIGTEIRAKRRGIEGFRADGSGWGVGGRGSLHGHRSTGGPLPGSCQEFCVKRDLLAGSDPYLAEEGLVARFLDAKLVVADTENMWFFSSRAEVEPVDPQTIASDVGADGQSALSKTDEWLEAVCRAFL